MRIVPENRILIQPTVQLQWIEQHRMLEFQLTQAQQSAFRQRWQSYQDSTETRLSDYLVTAQGQAFELHDDDLNFALLVGADFIARQHPSFNVTFTQDRLIWHI